MCLPEKHCSSNWYSDHVVPVKSNEIKKKCCKNSALTNQGLKGRLGFHIGLYYSFWRIKPQQKRYSLVIKISDQCAHDRTIPLLVQLQFIRPASLTNRLSITIIIEEMLWFCFNCFDGFSATEQNSTSVDYDGRSWKKRRWWVLVGKTLSTLLVRDCKNLKPRYVKIVG